MKPLRNAGHQNFLNRDSQSMSKRQAFTLWVRSNSYTSKTILYVIMLLILRAYEFVVQSWKKAFHLSIQDKEGNAF